MGRPQIGEIALHVQFNSAGKPLTIRYVDEEGCGHESATMDIELPMKHLVQYHIDHCRRSHSVTYQVMCEVTATVLRQGESHLLTCTRKKHEDGSPCEFRG